MLSLSLVEVFTLTLLVQLSAPLLQACDIGLEITNLIGLGSFSLTRLGTKTRT